MVKRVGKYEIGRTLGEGTFGKCAELSSSEVGQRPSGRHQPAGSLFPGAPEPPELPGSAQPAPASCLGLPEAGPTAPALCSTQPLACAARRVKYAVNTDTNERVAIKILDKEKIQKQNMGEQIKKARTAGWQSRPARATCAAARTGGRPGAVRTALAEAEGGGSEPRGACLSVPSRRSQ